MSAEIGNAASASTAAYSSPVFGREAIAILGAMVLLIVALTVLLVQTTWVNPASAAQTPPALDQGGLGSR